MSPWTLKGVVQTAQNGNRPLKDKKTEYDQEKQEVWQEKGK